MVVVEANGLRRRARLVLLQLEVHGEGPCELRFRRQLSPPACARTRNQAFLAAFPS
jgi:hypothetical protein